MIIHNLNDGKVLIKHETLIDPDNEFLLFDNLSDEDMLFYDFLKETLNKKALAVQVFEIIDMKTSFSDYFPPQKIWENTPKWEKWFKKFKSKHSLFLYFYEPNKRQTEIFDGHIDTNWAVNPKFNESATEQEFFELKDYTVHEHVIASTFQIHIYADVIYDCLKKSKVLECQNLLKEFSYHLLDQSVQIHSAKSNNIIKV